MEQVTSTGKLAEALSRAQAVITFAPKDSLNPHFKSHYADLASVWSAIRKPLTDNGLAITQGLETQGGTTVLVTTLLHSSGEAVYSCYPILLPQEKMYSPQMLGAAVTYARRYSLAAIVGIAQDDDDGNSVSVPAQNSAPVVYNHAPGADNGEKLAGYRIQFGKFKGKGFDELDPAGIKNYSEYIVRTAKDENKPIKGNVAEFLRLADEYLAGCDLPSEPPF